MTLDPQTTEITDTETILETLRAATRGTEYDGRLFLVGGFVRDNVMGLSSVCVCLCCESWRGVRDYALLSREATFSE